MSEKPISPLRQRLLEDMNMRRFVPDTQREYIRAVKKLASFLGRSPDSAPPEELRAFQLHLTETGLQPQSINATVTALRFFFKVTLDRPETTRRLVFVYEPRKLPRVLSPEEMLRLLEAAPGPKHKAALSVAYGAGLRAMEVVALKVCDVDSKRMMIRVEQGTRGCSELATRLFVHSGFAESAGETVQDRLHDVLEKSTLSGLDVNVGGHPGRWDEFRHAPENIILVQAHPHDIEFPTRVTVGACFGLHLLRQGVRRHVNDARPDHRRDALVERRQPHQGLLAYAHMRNVLGIHMCLDDALVAYR